MTDQEGGRRDDYDRFFEFTYADIEQSIQDRFEEIVRKYADRIALKTAKSSLTYFDVNETANRIGQAVLSREGTKRPVAILLEHGPLPIVAMLGILKAGGIYVALDPSHPPARNRLLIEDCRAAAIVANTRNLPAAKLISEDRCPLINIDDIDPHAAVDDIKLSILPDSPAVIIYTSGSTGKPKGAVHSHRNVLHAVMTFVNSYRLSAQDRQPLFFSSSYAWAVHVTFGTILTGGTLYPEDPRDLGVLHLAAWLMSEEISILQILPALFRQLIETLKNRDFGRFPRLRLVVMGGEPATQADADRWKRHFSEECMLVNHLGSTETLVISLYFIDMHTEVARGRLPVGRAAQDKDIFLVDEKRNKVGPDRVGEIAVQSRYITKGYWEKPDLTDEVLMQSGPGSEGRIFFTGDLGRFRSDGCLEHLGRKDSQVKIRGYSVHAAEIETALLEMPGVKEAAVVPWIKHGAQTSLRNETEEERSAGNGEIFLAAYVKPEGNAVLTVRAMRDFMKDKLPDYMIPASLTVMHDWPLTVSGKLDRRSLPHPDFVKTHEHEDLELPRTPEQEILLEIWGKVLGLESIGVRDNFFELGGHSLLAMRIISLVRDALRIELPLRAFFERPNVTELAALIEERRGTNEDSRPPLPRGSGEENVPLSFSQLSLLFLHQLAPDNPFYNVVQAFRLRGCLNTAFLKRALDILVSRHDILRATIKTTGLHPVQAIAPELHADLQCIDLFNIPGERREAEAKRLVSVAARTPFDFERGPLFRFLLIKLEKEEHILVITMHHIITDAWSMGVFNHELSFLYQSFLSGSPAHLPPLRVRYADFAHHQEQWMTSGAMMAQLAYWKERLEGAPTVLNLPTDRPRPAIQTYHGASLPLEVPAMLAKSLKALARTQGVTLYMVLLAAFQTLLHHYTAQDDIVVGSPIANRNYSELENLVGFFVNTLALRTDFSGNPAFLDLLNRVEETALGAFAHQDLPFEKLVEEIHPERDLSRNPLFQVMFVLQNASMQQPRMPDVVITPEDIDTGAAIFDLTLSLQERSEGLCGRINYSTDLFEEETIARMVGHFGTLLESIVADPRLPVSTLAILTEGEMHKILEEWNNTTADYPRQKCIHELFEEQVAKTPASSVISEDRHLTYFDLNRKANQLAHYLKRRGVGPGVPVGICMERSLEMVVAMLAILKTGAPYVPLDPTYPGERLGFMIDDTGALFVLTQSCLPDRIPVNGVEILSLDEDWDTVAKEAQGNLALSTSAENPACVIYTSGTTGRPKGVVISHRSVCNHLFWRHSHMTLTPSDRVLQMSSLSFDVSLGEIFECLTAGGQLILSRPRVNYDSPYLVDTIFKQQITVVSFSITVLTSFLSEPNVTTCKSLRRVNTGGEVMSAALKEHFCSLLDADLNYGYGPTEATIGVTYWRCNESGQPVTVPIGRPIANTQIYILDRHLQPVPVGVAGEIHIGGDAVALGYLNRPQLTAEKFIRNPFSGRSGSRLYKTGDFARYLSDGNIEFLGRFDNQVKVRGFRIELGEIEAALTAHPAVRESVVVAREERPGDMRLAAYVVPRAGQALTDDDLRRFLKKKLPHYMTPSSYFFLDALPLTSTGKVNRKALPESDATPSLKVRDVVPPRTLTEKTVAGVWQDLLRLDRLSVYDSFFDLGGHSLLALQCISHLRNTMGIDLGVSALFENVTIAELAGLIEDIMAVKAGASDPDDRRERGAL